MKAHTTKCEANSKIEVEMTAELNSGSVKKSAHKFVSVAAARSYISSASATAASMAEQELLDVLERVDAAYRQYPELELERPRESWVEDLPPAVLLRALPVLFGSQEIRWSAIKPILSRVLGTEQRHTVLDVISLVLPHVNFPHDTDAGELGEMLQPILMDELPARRDSRSLGKAVLSARRRLIGSARVAHHEDGGAAVLELAERLKSMSSPADRNPYTAAAWPSGEISFDEFLLQFPCEVAIPGELEDRSFVCEAIRSILLREPHPTEVEEYMNLVREGVSKSWILQDILASEELRSLDRRLRVIWNGNVITAPGNWAAAQMPAIAWRSGPADPGHIDLDQRASTRDHQS